MRLDPVQPGEGPPTNMTVVWLLSSVPPPVFLQVDFLREGLIANITFEWLLSCVCSHVPLQACDNSKPFSANIAGMAAIATDIKLCLSVTCRIFIAVAKVTQLAT